MLVKKPHQQKECIVRCKDLTAWEELMELISIAHVMSARTTSITDLSLKILSSDKPMVAMTSL